MGKLHFSIPVTQMMIKTEKMGVCSVYSAQVAYSWLSYYIVIHLQINTFFKLVVLTKPSSLSSPGAISRPC